MKKVCVAVLLGMVGIANASAQEGPWMVRARVVHIDTANKSDPVGGVGPSNTIHVSNKTIPELDISYFFQPNWAAELILTYPQKHRVDLSGTDIGSFKHLPPTLTLQYHFTPTAKFRPYVGAGVNYTRISSVDLLSGAGQLEKSSFGAAVQAGFDVQITPTMYFNVDLKKVQIRSDVSVAGTRVSQVKVDPLLLGVGLGWRF